MSDHITFEIDSADGLNRDCGVEQVLRCYDQLKETEMSPQKSLKQRTVDMLFRLEWSINRSDGHGDRCPCCGVERGVPHKCDLHQLCNEIRDAMKPRDASLAGIELPK